jgi:hypothetical protein
MLTKGIFGSGKAELRLSCQETRAHRPPSDCGNRAVILLAASAAYSRLWPTRETSFVKRCKINSFIGFSKESYAI